MTVEPIPEDGFSGMREWTEYAVRYDAPESFAGRIGNARLNRSVAEAVARADNNNPQIPDLSCTVVSRTVTASDWEPVA